MSVLYNSALRQSKSIRADLEAFSSCNGPNPALQGQLTTSLTSFSRTLDDYQKNINLELVPEKAEKGKERIVNFRSDLLELRNRFAELKHEKEVIKSMEDRNELLGRRQHAGHTPENPYADSAIASGGGRGHVNPLFRANNLKFAPSATPPGQESGGPHQSLYALGADGQREAHALRENNFLAQSNQTLDEYLERGRAVLGDLGQQREVLKNTQRKLYNIGNTLGISGDTIRMVERRAKQDKWIFWGGVVGFVCFVYLVLRWVR